MNIVKQIIKTKDDIIYKICRVCKIKKDSIYGSQFLNGEFVCFACYFQSSNKN